MTWVESEEIPVPHNFISEKSYNYRRNNGTEEHILAVRGNKYIFLARIAALKGTYSETQLVAINFPADGQLPDGRTDNGIVFFGYDSSEKFTMDKIRNATTDGGEYRALSISTMEFHFGCKEGELPDLREGVTYIWQD